MTITAPTPTGGPAPAPDPAPSTPPRLGFACAWTPDPTTTWSGTPWSLFQALVQRDDLQTIDLGVHPSGPTTALMKARSLRRHGGRWVSPWRHSEAWQAWMADDLRAAATRHDCDLVLEIGDLVALDRPFALYQDLCYDTLLELHDVDTDGTMQFPGLGLDDLRRLRDRQHGFYEQAACVFTMSSWLAGELVRFGVDPAKVRTVHPGTETATTSDAAARRRLERPRRRLLLVGREFQRKGGDLAVAALERLRRDVDPGITLTVVGPRTWEPETPVPAGVFPVGALPPSRLPAIWDEHDLLVMPSRLEGFGKVFAEALAAGMPCIGRDAYAMPEIITPGRNGELVVDDDPDELAEKILAVLGDDHIYRTCYAERGAVAEHYSWRRAADRMAGALGGVRAGR